MCYSVWFACLVAGSKSFFLVSLSLSLYLSLCLCLSRSTSHSWTGFVDSFSEPNPPSQVGTPCFVLLWSYYDRFVIRAVSPYRTPVLIMFRAFGTSPAEAPPSAMDFYHPWGISVFSSKGEFCATRDTVTALQFTGVPI